jgi:predicted enzyme related to lactoylglutathione lyase
MAALLINVDVPDIERGIAFYCAAFELRLGRRFGEDFVELLGAETPVYLLKKDVGQPPFSGAAVGRDYARHWTPVHLDFVVSDLGTALARALAAGGKQEGDVSHHAYGQLALLSDPFGHGICLLQFNDAGYDAIASGS